ncbi:glucosamine kinase nucleotide-binding domain-containing protein [Paracoccus aminovorans]|uniref:BadF/BadG/BcrA/BcrD ATPase family protein n=1 Tax=Paracoccus aminovorans TaxID=34004 RepID=UPI002B2646AC|nr:BadF/BadG/BcrA/BcrD ATPase family protein [Paracoccus aminovorans]
MAYFLGIDGGGSGCRAAVADGSGRILGRGAAGPANISVETEGACANILAAARAALQQAGRGRLEELTAVLGLAGANVTAAARRLQAMLPFRRARILTDAATAAAGALGDADGIVVAVGTGSVLAVQAGGAVRQYGGRGFLLGDEGSGAVLGRALLAEALRTEDGFAPTTPLLRAVLDQLGGVEGVIGFGLRARPAEFAAFAPRIVAGTDPAGERIFAAAVAQLGEMIQTLQAGRDLPVVFLGGLGPHYAARLQGRWRLQAPLGTGLDGALHLARRDEAGVNDPPPPAAQAERSPR